MPRLLVILLTLVCAASGQDRLALMDVFQVETASDPQISPDGKRIVYVRQFADVMTDKRYSNLWMVNADGTGHRPLTAGNFSDSAPRWSPDGSSLLYISDRDGKPQIWRRWMDTGVEAKLTSLAEAPSRAEWSPDGRQIAFIALVPEKGAQVAQLPAPPEGAKWAEPARVIDRLVYRFNGVGYLKPGYEHLFVLPAEGGTPRQISRGNYHHGGGAWRASAPVWAADGRSILLSANRHDNFEQDPADTEIYDFGLDGSVKALTDRRGPDNDPAVSPGGRLIAWTGFDDRLQGYQVTRLYVMNRDGSGRRALTESYDRDVQSPRFSPDGSAIYFLSDNEGNTGLYRLTLADGRIAKIAGDIGSTRSAYGGGGSFTIGAGGAYATVVTRPDMPGDVAAGNLAGGTPRKLTALNEDLFAGKKLGAVEMFWYESKKDKRKIQAWIIKPPDFDPSKKYPLILEIHGGPFANYGDRFDLEKQLMAAAGYVVVYTNPRGSTSYGGEFGNLIHHAYPGDDFFDLDSGVDAVVAKGYVDPTRLYVTGGSGGGVLTCWMIGRTTRFRAAVTVYPVINWYSFVLTSDIGNWTSKRWFPGLPWDHPEHYEKRSLLSVVKNVKTPAMVLTGEADWRTPMSDSEQYYQALKLLGVESVLVRVPDEPHGIQARPSHHVSKIAHIIGWFDRHGK